MKAILAAFVVLAAAGTAGGATGPFTGTITFSADNQLFVVKAGAPAKLTHDRVGVVGIAWSPDGTRLLAWRYRKTPAVAVLRADGSVVRTLVSGIYAEPSWSPDGTRIAFQLRENGRALYVIHVDGTGLRRVATNSLPSSYDSHIGWSHDGREVVYAGTDRDGYGILAANADGSGSHRLISTGKTFVTSPSWSPDGAHLAFVHNARVAIAAADGTGATDVGPAAFGPVWSPDGAHLAFVGRRGNWVVGADGRGLRRLPGCACRNVWPGFFQRLAWSPGSNEIAYSGGTGPGKQPLSGIYVERIDGSPAVRVAYSATAQYSWPLWRP
jgi:Tol biopolymer transport system component